jgi:hypothetical protein
MAIQVSCSCGANMNVPDKYRGRKIRCRECSGSVQVPALKLKRLTTTSPELSNSLPPRTTQAGRKQARQSVSSFSDLQLSIIARVLSVVVMIFVLWFLVDRYNTIFDDAGNIRKEIDSLEQSNQVLIGAAVLIGVGIPAAYVVWHGVRTGSAASRVRKKGVKAMLVGGVLSILGIIGMLVVGGIAAALGGIAIMGVFLVPLGLLIAGVVNTITGVVIPHCTNGSGGRELGSGRMWFVFDEGITRRA